MSTLGIGSAEMNEVAEAVRAAINRAATKSLRTVRDDGNINTSGIETGKTALSLFHPMIPAIRSQLQCWTGRTVEIERNRSKKPSFENYFGRSAPVGRPGARTDRGSPECEVPRPDG